ncbi:MAG TPA: hypothetical protein VGQ60_04015 [Nitrospiraceae bacterium]|jgi:hypothetical protein|nr:hypothetical protein [Nitrospiraceae bacterium]
MVKPVGGKPEDISPVLPDYSSSQLAIMAKVLKVDLIGDGLRDALNAPDPAATVMALGREA